MLTAVYWISEQAVFPRSYWMLLAEPKWDFIPHSFVSKLNIMNILNAELLGMFNKPWWWLKMANNMSSKYGFKMGLPGIAGSSEIHTPFRPCNSLPRRGVKSSRALMRQHRHLELLLIRVCCIYKWCGGIKSWEMRFNDFSYALFLCFLFCFCSLISYSCW